MLAFLVTTILILGFFIPSFFSMPIAYRGCYFGKGVRLLLYMSRRENLNTYISIPYMGNCALRDYRWDFDHQRKLLSYIETNLSIYDQKGSFAFALEQMLHMCDESSFSGQCLIFTNDFRHLRRRSDHALWSIELPK